MNDIPNDSKPASQATKILLVEDNEANRDMLTRRLQRSGFTVCSAADGFTGVLHMPKADSEEVELSLHPVDLDRCLEEVSATCRNLISNNGNTFALEKHGELGMIQTDDLRLRQILINLLGNAGKFTRNGKVVLRTSRQKEGNRDQVLFSVQDTGIGIATEAIPNLFKNFSQVHSSMQSNMYGGTGLGLALSQQLAQLLNGEISVESRLGHGSEFTLRLPAGAQAFAAVA